MAMRRTVLQAELAKAVSSVRPTRLLAERCGEPRTVLLYWAKWGAPYYRKATAQRVIETAKGMA